jgi:MFS family permease
MMSERQRRLIAILVISGHALATIAWVMLVPAMPALSTQFGGSQSGRLSVQSLVFLPLAAMLVGAPLAAFVSDRFGPRATLMLLLVLYAICGAAGAFAPNLAVLTLGRLVLGFACGGLVALCSGITGDAFEGASRERVLGWSFAISALGTVIVLPLSGVLVDAYGWQAPFFLYLIGLIVLAVALAIPALPGTMRKQTSPRHIFSATLNRILVLTFLLGIGMQVLTAQGPFMMQTAQATSGFAFGLLAASAGLASVLGSALYDLLQRRAGTATTIVTSTLVLAVSIATLTGASTGYITFLAAASLFGFGAGLVMPALNSLVLARCANDVRAHASGFMISALSLGQFANPLAYAALERQFDPGPSLTILASIVAIAGLLLRRIAAGNAAAAAGEKVASTIAVQHKAAE